MVLTTDRAKFIQDHIIISVDPAILASDLDEIIPDHAKTTGDHEIIIPVHVKIIPRSILMAGLISQTTLI